MKNLFKRNKKVSKYATIIYGNVEQASPIIKVKHTKQVKTVGGVRYLSTKA